MVPAVPRPGPRALDRGALLDALAAAEAPVLVVTGPPGVGKSTLVAAWAATLPEDELLWIGTQHCAGLDELAQRIAEACGRPAATGLAAASGDGRPRTVVLDQCDRLPLGPGALPAAPGLRWVLTRRGPLPGLPELAVPPLGAEAGGRLFRAAGSGPAPSAPQLAALVQRCDGLPLALSLAARRQRLLGTRALLARLARSTAVLGEGLAAVLRESIEALEPADRQALAVLGCGPDPVPVGAVEPVLAAEGAPFDRLERLMDAGLLARGSDPGTVRVLRVAVDQLGAPDERHLERWRVWARATATRWAAGEAPDFPRVVSQALIWSVDRAAALDPVARLDLAMALKDLAGGPVLRRLVDGLSLEQVPPDRQVELLRCQVRGLELSGQLQAAAALLDRAGEAGKDPAVIGTIAFAMDRQGQPGAALRFLLDRVERHLPAAALDATLYATVAHLGRYAGWLQWWWAGEGEAAEALLERILRQRPVDAAAPLGLLQGLAVIRLHNRQDAASLAALHDVQQRIFEEGRRPLYLSGQLSEATQRWWPGQDPGAIGVAEAALALAEELKSAAGIAHARLSLAEAAAGQGRTAAAHAHLEAGLQALQGTNLGSAEQQLLAELAVLQADRGQLDESIATTARLEAPATAGGDRYGYSGLAAIPRGHQALQRALRADDPAPHLDLLEAVLAMDCPPGTAALAWTRLHERLQERAAAKAPPRRAPEVLRVGADCRWFQAEGGPPCDLRRSRNNRRMLAALVESALSGGGPLDSGALVARVWPGEQLVERSGRHRVHVALSALRKGGLAPFLERSEAGYRLVVAGGIVRDERDRPPVG